MLKKHAQFIWLYAAFFVAFLIAVATVWTTFVNGTLYYCTDKTPVLDFIPPFVHGSATTPPYGDYFIADQKIVWAIWIALVVVLFVGPFFSTKLLMKSKK